MTLTTLVITISAVAFILTMVIGALFQRQKTWTMTFFQNFAGVLFVFSGFVKAIDPLGTAYKMEQYFAEFQSTFAETGFSFLAPLFPWLSSYSLVFSIVMIVFEIVLGLMLLLGSRRKLTSWLFLLLVVFFTFLTGFTYLTGYVPAGANFFSFGEWGEYNELQMKVTDCGCFGDFLKLEPRVSFLKDVFLLIPAVFFVWKHEDMHQLFNSRTRSAILWGLGALLTLYCINNSVWRLPHTDFRPFKKGVNIYERKALEEQSEADREIISFTLKNKLNGKFVELPYAQYLSEYKSYPKTEWEVVEQNMTEPTVPETKISEFIIYGPNEEEVTEQILTNPDPFFMIVCHKLYHHGSSSETVTRVDTVMTITDTIIEGTDTTYQYEPTSRTVEEMVMHYNWDEQYLNRFREEILPLSKAAEAAGVKTIAVVGGADSEMIRDFKNVLDIPFTVCTADDILLKTIVRSNPGPVLMRSGEILDKWHYRKLPAFDEIKSMYIP